jgi:hypothetical protein
VTAIENSSSLIASHQLPIMTGGQENLDATTTTTEGPTSQEAAQIPIPQDSITVGVPPSQEAASHEETTGVVPPPHGEEAITDVQPPGTATIPEQNILEPDVSHLLL